MASMLNQNHLGVLDHAVAFLNHLGIFRNFNQVIISLLEVHRNMKKEKHTYKCRFQSLFPPLLSMIAAEQNHPRCAV